MDRCDWAKRKREATSGQESGLLTEWRWDILTGTESSDRAVLGDEHKVELHSTGEGCGCPVKYLEFILQVKYWKFIPYMPKAAQEMICNYIQTVVSTSHWPTSKVNKTFIGAIPSHFVTCIPPPATFSLISSPPLKALDFLAPHRFFPPVVSSLLYKTIPHSSSRPPPTKKMVLPLMFLMVDRKLSSYNNS